MCNFINGMFVFSNMFLYLNWGDFKIFWISRGFCKYYVVYNFCNLLNYIYLVIVLNVKWCFWYDYLVFFFLNIMGWLLGFFVFIWILY